MKRNCIIFIIVGVIVVSGLLLLLSGAEPIVVSPENETDRQTTHELITVTSPDWGATVESPLSVTGEARGYWFFEATAPVSVVDWDGLIIGEGYIEATAPWMTEDFVPFSGTILFDTALIRNGYSNNGTLILQRHNASGLPQHDDAFEIPIIFK